MSDKDMTMPAEILENDAPLPFELMIELLKRGMERRIAVAEEAARAREIHLMKSEIAGVMTGWPERRELCHWEMAQLRNRAGMFGNALALIQLDDQDLTPFVQALFPDAADAGGGAT